MAALIAGLLWNFANAILLLQTSDLWQYLYFDGAFAFNTTMLVATLLCLGAAGAIGLLMRRAPSAAADAGGAGVEAAPTALASR